MVPGLGRRFHSNMIELVISSARGIPRGLLDSRLSVLHGTEQSGVGENRYHMVKNGA